MSTQSRRSSTTARRRRILALLPAVVGALVGALCVPAAASAASPQTHAASDARAAWQGRAAPDIRAAAGDDDEPSLELSLPDFGMVDGEFTANVVLDNPSDGNPLTAATGDPLPAGRVALERGTEALDSRDDLADWLAGSSGQSVVEIGSTPTDEIAVGSSIDIDIDADVSDAADGVYPIRARFRPAFGSDGDDLTDATALTRSGDDDPTVQLVVPITAPASSRGLLTAEQLATLTGKDGALRHALDGVDGTGAILAVDPAIPASIRVLGGAAPATAAAWLDDLLALPNDRFALQFGDADVATQLADDPGTLVEPTSLAPYIAGAGDAEDAGAGEPADEPSPTPTPGADPVDMSLDELLRIGEARDDLYWPDPDIAGAETVAAVSDLGGTALMPSSAVRGGGTAAARAPGALVYDADASARFTRAVAITAVDERTDALTEAVADLWLASDDVDGASLLVALDRTGGVRSAEAQDNDDAHPASRSAEGIADAADAVSGFLGGSLPSLMAEKPRNADFTEAGEPLRTGVSAELADHEEDLTDIASVLADPQLLLGRTRAEQLQLLSVSWSAHRGLWRDAYDAHLQSLDALAESVGLVPPSDVNLLSSEAPLPVWVRNDLPYPVTVTLYSYPDDVRLSMDTSVEVQAQPSSNTRVQLPVEASLGSGDVSIRLSLESPSGIEIGDEQTMRVTVRADWERYGIAGLIALIVLLIVAGTVRTVLRRRARTRRTEGADDETSTGTASVAADDPIDETADHDELDPGDAALDDRSDDDRPARDGRGGEGEHDDDAPAEDHDSRDGDDSHEEEDTDGKSR